MLFKSVCDEENEHQQLEDLWLLTKKFATSSHVVRSHQIHHDGPISERLNVTLASCNISRKSLMNINLFLLHDLRHIIPKPPKSTPCCLTKPQPLLPIRCPFERTQDFTFL